MSDNITPPNRHGERGSHGRFVPRQSSPEALDGLVAMARIEQQIKSDDELDDYASRVAFKIWLKNISTIAGLGIAFFVIAYFALQLLRLAF